MENKGLLFIPDISGFTKFVTETEISHSRLIIQELLELLINANQTGLEISEVEGDAILFYKFGEVPDLQDLYKQVEKMFSDFHRYLAAYDVRRFCQCKACTAAVDLTLKVISHYGEFTSYNVKNFKKLLGKDVIVAHQLLKNDIEQHEYWLVTESLSQSHQPGMFSQWMQWNSSGKKTESGAIPFHYTQLTPLKNELPTEPAVQPEFPQKTKVLSLSREYDAHIITLFHATGDFNYRPRWKEGVIKVEEVSHFLPRVGTKCRCITRSGETIITMSGYSFNPVKVQFSETDETKQTAARYTLESITPERTRLTVDYYIPKSITGKIAFTFFNKNKITASLERSLARMTDLVKDIHVATEY